MPKSAKTGQGAGGSASRRRTGASAKKGTTKTGTRRAPAKKAAPEITNYQSALAYLYDRVDLERARMSRVDPGVFKLDRMKAIMDGLGKPQSMLRCVHIAGTNGKGSVSAMIGSCLHECGCGVGIYTSPHLTDVRERVQIDGQMITHQRLVEVLGRIAEVVEKLPKRLGQATFFELMTAVALVHFAEQAVDVAIIEVGLGGRLDATNIIEPDVAVVAGIGLDHTQVLGEDLESIAREKAGIFKQNAAAITFKQDSKVVAALREVAEGTGATLNVVGDDIDFSFRFEASPQLGPHMRVGLSTPRCTFEHVPVPLPGEHQALNCGLALAVIDQLSMRGFDLPEAKVISGLEKTTIPARLEQVWERPRILLDGAHNPDAIGALVRSLGAYLTCDSLVMIFGCAADKDVDGMLKQLVSGADKVIFTKAKGNPRAADPEELAKRFAESSGKMCQTAPTLEDALSIASRAASRDDLICITGSFFLAGEAKKLLADKAKNA